MSNRICLGVLLGLLQLFICRNNLEVFEMFENRKLEVLGSMKYVYRINRRNLSF